MAEVILMPRLSDTMTEGVIAAWHKKVGDAVKKGDLLAEIETDKATMELESYKDGTLLYIGGDKGGKLQVDDLLAIIGKQGEDISSLTSGKTIPAPETKPVENKETKPATVAASTATGAATVETTPTVPEDGGRIKASPLAKKLAREKGIDINSLSGSGDGGRIIKADIDNMPAQAAGSTKQTVSKPQFVTAPLNNEEGYTDIPNSQMRGVIARRLAESNFTAPHFFLTMEINMDNAISARMQLNEISPVKISFNDMVVKAVALALRNPSRECIMDGRQDPALETYSYWRGCCGRRRSDRAGDPFCR